MLHPSCHSRPLRRLVSLAAVIACLASTADAASRFTNVSVRASAGTNTDTLIVGFTIAGTGSKQLLLRGVGPTLSLFKVTDFVTDPALQLVNQADGSFTTNDNWDNADAIVSAAKAVGAFELPADSRDAALLRSLPTGSFSAHLLANSGPGIALVEAYDMDTGTPTAQIANISTRCLAGGGASVLTIGFTIAGDTPKTVLLRAVGPSLSAFNVTGMLVNPQLRLFSGRGNELGYNDDWPTTAGYSAAFNATGAFPLTPGTRDAALLVSLPPGSYTAQASGVNNAVGVSLIEVYDVPNPPETSFVLRPVENVRPEPTASTPTTFGPSVNPVVLTQARPQYPFELRVVGFGGEALIEFIVGNTGRVSDAYAVHATDARLADAALVAVRQWTFLPGRNASGQAIAVRMQVPIIFTLN